ncbi:unnamed protein product [Ceratitis capitata]|uniref:(Mediterranean fruit fly) hypothetical protein n=1 Tax=Ceratitis capitata TaxID=7213 RepID=A0A811V7W8_CERCA|nr:unnamed protein product [Ceratitis capitata]
MSRDALDAPNLVTNTQFGLPAVGRSVGRSVGKHCNTNKVEALVQLADWWCCAASAINVKTSLFLVFFFFFFQRKYASVCIFALQLLVGPEARDWLYFCMHKIDFCSNILSACNMLWCGFAGR